MAQDEPTFRADAPAGYSTDIRPLFRDHDVTCMDNQGVEIGNVDYMCDASGDGTFPDHANARLVYSRVADGSMPPDGVWSQVNLDLYQRWMWEGFAR